MQTPCLAATLLVALAATFPTAQETTPVDHGAIDRTLRVQPEYVASPRYALFLFGTEGEVRVWAILDKSDASHDYYDVLYFDRDGDGDPTEAGERFTAEYDEAGEAAGIAVDLRIGDLPVPGTDLVHRSLRISTVPKKGREGVWFQMRWNGETEMSGGYGPVGTDTTRWGVSPADAPVFRPTPRVPLAFALYTWGDERVELKIGGSGEVFVMIGSPGSGPDTMMVLDENYLDLAKDELTVTLIAKDADGNELQTRSRLVEHC